jgi:hypothetical protein
MLGRRSKIGFWPHAKRASRANGPAEVRNIVYGSGADGTGPIKFISAGGFRVFERLP